MMTDTKASSEIDPPHRRSLSRNSRHRLIYAIPFSPGFISTVVSCAIIRLWLTL
ncbi:unnamed protein product, partial [Closterium sp. NIES-54]